MRSLLYGPPVSKSRSASPDPRGRQASTKSVWLKAEGDTAAPARCSSPATHHSRLRGRQFIRRTCPRPARLSRGSAVTTAAASASAEGLEWATQAERSYGVIWSIERQRTSDAIRALSTASASPPATTHGARMLAPPPAEGASSNVCISTDSIARSPRSRSSCRYSASRSVCEAPFAAVCSTTPQGGRCKPLGRGVWMSGPRPRSRELLGRAASRIRLSGAVPLPTYSTRAVEKPAAASCCSRAASRTTRAARPAR
mmetsp:Transcript_8112/g.26719  ORF Transcript_8112/g.26719 Transcript_8112/m.26719 type:complete len:256 (-) Transcript_8112:831-1598(-)